jgi:hypothetical protein
MTTPNGPTASCVASLAKEELIGGPSDGLLDRLVSTAVARMQPTHYSPSLPQLLELSIQIAVLAHANQLDKAGMPYILHPLRVMARFQDLKLQIIAALHDVVEDTSITALQLRQMGFYEDIVDAVLALSRSPEETYADFIERCGGHSLARLVKIADLEDNMSIPRLLTLQEKDLGRLQRYHRSLKKLTEGHPEDLWRK